MLIGQHLYYGLLYDDEEEDTKPHDENDEQVRQGCHRQHVQGVLRQVCHILQQGHNLEKNNP